MAEVPNKEFLANAIERMINRIHFDNPNVPAMPSELVATVLSYLGLGEAAGWRVSSTFPSRTTVAWKHPAETSPRNGSCPFLKLPAELRRVIFSDLLLDRNKIVYPTCTDEHGSAPKNDKSPAKRNRTSTLMCINRWICSEIATIIYEEREIAIHVHEGIAHSGIEFFNVGRQPLQYKDELEDRRFEKFRHGENFGFDRIKKIKVVIYPAAGDNRLVSMNTYYMNLALVRLLERSEGEDRKNRINSLTITFADQDDKTGVREQVGRRAIMKSEHYWWNASNDCPRSTSIHGTSNIELVLLPFSRLRSHNVHITLPEKLASHVDTACFVSNLEQRMKSDLMTDLIDDKLLMHLEAGREAYEEHVITTLHGTQKYFDLPKLTERDLREDAEKRDLSPASEAFGGDRKRAKSDPPENKRGNGRGQKRSAYRVVDGKYEVIDLDMGDYNNDDYDDGDFDKAWQRTLYEKVRKRPDDNDKAVRRVMAGGKGIENKAAGPHTTARDSHGDDDVVITKIVRKLGTTTAGTRNQAGSSQQARPAAVSSQGRTLGRADSGVDAMTTGQGLAAHAWVRREVTASGAAGNSGASDDGIRVYAVPPGGTTMPTPQGGLGGAGPSKPETEADKAWKAAGAATVAAANASFAPRSNTVYGGRNMPRAGSGLRSMTASPLSSPTSTQASWSATSSSGHTLGGGPGSIRSMGDHGTASIRRTAFLDRIQAQGGAALRAGGVNPVEEEEKDEDTEMEY